MPNIDELIAAIGKRDAARVREMLAADPSLPRTRPANGPSAVMMAAYVRDDEITAMVRREAWLDACEAAALGDTVILSQLISANVGSVNDRSPDGWTPLHLAAFFGRRDAVDLLLARNADLDAISGGQERNTPLHAALAGACDEHIVRQIVRYGADVNAKGTNDYAPLHVAASRGSDELVRLLVDNGAEVNAAMTDGKTAADIAADRNHPATAALLRGLGGR